MLNILFSWCLFVICVSPLGNSIQFCNSCFLWGVRFLGVWSLRLCLSQTLVSCQMYNWWGCSPIPWAVSSIQCFLCFTVSWGLIWWPSVLFPKWLDFCSYYLGYKWLLLAISAHQSQSGEQWIISQWEKKESLSSYLYKIINEKKGIFECQLINVQRMV